MKTVLALTILAAVSHAGEVCHTTSYSSAVTNWTQQFVVPKHDPALGALQSVTVRLNCVIGGDFGVENVLGFTTQTLESQFTAICALHRPDGSGMLAVQPRVGTHMTLGPDDGVLDFAGPSGEFLTGLNVDRDSHVVLTGAADLALFTGSGQTIALDLFANGASFTTGNTGPLTMLVNTQAAVTVTVCYGYREIVQTSSIPSQTLNWNQSRTFTKHDPALGPLRAVRIRARNTVNGTVRVESPSPIELLVYSLLWCTTRVELPDTTPVLEVHTYFPFFDPLAAFDGVIDFAGASGADHGSVSIESSAQSTLNSPADLALFTATFPGETLSLGVAASNASFVIGGGPIVTQLLASAGCDLEVYYDYSAPITLYCFGDGSGATCPCGNASSVGAQVGCLNSLGIGGALRASGFAEIGSDTLVLTASNLPTATTALFFQGTSAVSTAFGDGLRCAGGTTQRLGIRAVSAGAASIPQAGTFVSTLGSASSGTTLRYQAWYRNAAAFCTPSSFNLTNGVAIAW